jgi:hypothetical protein
MFECSVVSQACSLSVLSHHTHPTNCPPPHTHTHSQATTSTTAQPLPMATTSTTAQEVRGCVHASPGRGYQHSSFPTLIPIPCPPTSRVGTLIQTRGPRTATRLLAWLTRAPVARVHVVGACVAMTWARSRLRHHHHPCKLHVRTTASSTQSRWP